VLPALTIIYFSGFGHEALRAATEAPARAVKQRKESQGRWGKGNFSARWRFAVDPVARRPPAGGAAWRRHGEAAAAAPPRFENGRHARA
jgi:hypothetical protein